ncbi:MAG: hypothetical protein GY872_17270 [Roseibacillus sp.]|nr:hypothetical protein [Roseibacillus sp.]
MCDIEIHSLSECGANRFELYEGCVNGLLLYDSASSALISFQFLGMRTRFIACLEEEPLPLSGRGQVEWDVQEPPLNASF